MKPRDSLLLQWRTRLPPFDDGKDKWSSYVIFIESYFEGNNIVEDAQKRPLLYWALELRSTGVLSGRCAPRKVNQLTYKKGEEISQYFFNLQPNEMAESFTFFTRVQISRLILTISYED
ncbi:hypothetical protein MRX96_012866 [Rhipicephalus microplus]